MPDIRVTSWTELQDCLFGDSWQEPIARFRSPFAFRGILDAEEPLLTSLARIGGEFGNNEPHVLRAFRKYARPGFEYFRGDSVWNWLALAKHHGLPTRLLDWSYSPLVALHFATQDFHWFDRDGAVWCVDYGQTNARLPAILKDVLARESAGVFTAEMLDEAAQTLAKLDQL